MDEHDAALLAADARYSRSVSRRDEVGELAGDLRAGVPAARDEERQQPPPLLRVALDVGELEHLEQVVLEREAVGEGLQLERVLGEARVGLEVLGRAEREHELVVARARSVRRRGGGW